MKVKRRVGENNVLQEIIKNENSLLGSEKGDGWLDTSSHLPGDYEWDKKAKSGDGKTLLGSRSLF